MLSARTVTELRAALRPARRAEHRVGLVPTMGALHEGHLSLLRHARAHCDVVVMSLFVNPTQFDDAGDLAAYPRDERRDAELAELEGVDVLLAPPADAVYPPGFATTVTVGGPAKPLEGACRGAGHFAGVATVVAKLLGMVAPDVAYFGAKDAQQVAVVRRLVADLDIPCEIEARPTVREPDGLAMSSRNVRLDADQRARAVAVPRALQDVRVALARGERDPVAATRAGRERLAAAGAALDYLEIVDPQTFTSAPRVADTALVVLAARFGDVRLIDNLAVSCPNPDPEPEVATPVGAPTA